VIAIENVRLFDEVQARTRELARSVEELRALGEVSRAVNSTLDLETVLATIVAKAVQLSNTDAGVIYVLDELDQTLRVRATYGLSDELVEAIRGQPAGASDALRRAIQDRQPLEIADIRDEPPSPVREIAMRAGFRARLVVPLVGTNRVVGALVIRRKQPGKFPTSTAELLQKSVLAIQNARLFSEIDDKSRQLQAASEHKSQFVASMSFSFGSQGFILAPEMSNEILSCLTDITTLAGLVRNISISSSSIKFLVDNELWDVAAWACEASCFANNPTKQIGDGIGEMELEVAAVV
jgi:transcriptional regulator with GAF, ATPase, and Fis domain